MKTYLKNITLLFIIGFFFCYSVSIAQTDNEIIKTSKNLLSSNNCEEAFNTAITVENKFNEKMQELLVDAYPCIMKKNFEEAYKYVVYSDDDAKSQLIKLYKFKIYLDKNAQTDSIFKKYVKLLDYNTYTRSKSIQELVASYNEKILQIKKIIVSDSIAAISKKNEVAVTTTNTIVNTTKSDTSSSTTTSVSNTATTATTVEKYYLIAGSYKTETLAQNAVDKLKTQGYSNAEVVGKNDYGSYRICYSSFDDKNAATTELNRLKNGGINSSVWLLTVNVPSETAKTDNNTIAVNTSVISNDVKKDSVITEKKIPETKITETANITSTIKKDTNIYTNETKEISINDQPSEIEKKPSSTSQNNKKTIKIIAYPSNNSKQIRINPPSHVHRINKKNHRSKGNSLTSAEYTFSIPYDYKKDYAHFKITAKPFSKFTRTMYFIWRNGFKYPIALGYTCMALFVDATLCVAGDCSGYFLSSAGDFWTNNRKFNKEKYKGTYDYAVNNYYNTVSLNINNQSIDETYTNIEYDKSKQEESDSYAVGVNDIVDAAANVTGNVNSQNTSTSTTTTNNNVTNNTEPDLSFFTPEEQVYQDDDLKVVVGLREIALPQSVYCTSSNSGDNGKKMHLMEYSVKVTNISGKGGYLKGLLNVGGNSNCACRCNEALNELPLNNCKDNLDCNTDWYNGKGCGICVFFGKDKSDYIYAVYDNETMIYEKLCYGCGDYYFEKKLCWYFEYPGLSATDFSGTIKLYLIKDP